MKNNLHEETSFYAILLWKVLLFPFKEKKKMGGIWRSFAIKRETSEKKLPLNFNREL